MQKYVRARTPPYDNNKNKNANTESTESNQDTQEVFEFKREKCDLFEPDYGKINYEEMLKNGLERRAALIKKRRRSRTPPQKEEINTENQSQKFEKSVHKYVLASFTIYFFWILFK